MFIGSDEALCSKLSRLTAQLRPQRSDQLPPLVKVDELILFLQEALEENGRPRTSWDLTKIAWRCLEPSPETAYILQSDERYHTSAATEEGKEIEDRTTRSSEEQIDDTIWLGEVDIIAGQIVDEMPLQRQQVVALELSKVKQAEIVKRLQISRGTIHNEMNRFQSSLLRIIEEKDLNEEKAMLLLQIILDILKAEAFFEG